MKTRQKYNNGAGKAARMYLDWHRANPLVCSPARLGLLALEGKKRKKEENFPRQQGRNLTPSTPVV